MNRARRSTRSSPKTIDPVHVELAKLSGYGAPPSPLTPKGKKFALVKHPKHKEAKEYEEYDHTDDVQSSPLTPCRSSSAALSPPAQCATPPKDRTPHVAESTVSIIFQNMSTEVHQLVMSYLPKDFDVYNYTKVCRATRNLATDSVWRLRFVQTFDVKPGPPETLTVDKLSEIYKCRQFIAKHWTCFDMASFGGVDKGSKQVQAELQDQWLGLLRTLILESDARRVYHQGVRVVNGLNIQFIRKVLTGDCGASYLDIIDSIFRTEKDRAGRGRDIRKVVTGNSKGALLYVVQLCLAPFTLHPALCKNSSNFDNSQRQVYATNEEQPIFRGAYKGEVNVRWLLHVINFFKYHVKASEEGILAHAYKTFMSNSPDQLPQPWVGRIRAQTQPLGAHWKGAHVYMEYDSMLSLRATPGGIYTDSLESNETFQDISLFFDTIDDTAWPKSWNNQLNSNPWSQAKIRSGAPEVKSFWGTNQGARMGLFFGHVHAVNPQSGVHGFQRMTLTKFYIKKVGGDLIHDPDDVWLYEGCVLPGGAVIAGRWWHQISDPNNVESSTGPFIWWNVERSDATFHVPKEAVEKFLEETPWY